MIWVVMTDAWSVIGPFPSEQDAKAFAAKYSGDAVLMITPELFEQGVDERG